MLAWCEGALDPTNSVRGVEALCESGVPSHFQCVSATQRPRKDTAAGQRETGEVRGMRMTTYLDGSR